MVSPSPPPPVLQRNEQAIPTAILEKLSGIDPASPLGVRFQKAMEQYLKDKPALREALGKDARFVLLQSGELDAFYLTRSNPPTYGLSLTVLQNESLCIGVLAHEAHHRVASETNSKVQEGTADWAGISMIHRYGLPIDPFVDAVSKNSNTSVIDELRSLIDVHPTSAARRIIADLFVTHEELYGTPVTQTKPPPSAAIQSLSSEASALVKDSLSFFPSYQSSHPLPEYLHSLARSLTSRSHVTAVESAAVERHLYQAVLEPSERRLTSESASSETERQRLHELTSAISQSPRLATAILRSIDYRPIGIFEDLNVAIQGFCRAKESKQISEAALQVMSETRKLMDSGISQHVLERLTFSSFPEAVRGNVVPWQRHLAALDQVDAGEKALIVDVLKMNRVFDPRLNAIDPTSAFVASDPTVESSLPFIMRRWEPRASHGLIPPIDLVAGKDGVVERGDATAELVRSCLRFIVNNNGEVSPSLLDTLNVLTSRAPGATTYCRLVSELSLPEREHLVEQCLSGHESAARVIGIALRDQELRPLFIHLVEPLFTEAKKEPIGSPSLKSERLLRALLSLGLDSDGEIDQELAPYVCGVKGLPFASRLLYLDEICRDLVSHRLSETTILASLQALDSTIPETPPDSFSGALTLKRHLIARGIPRGTYDLLYAEQIKRLSQTDSPPDAAPYVRALRGWTLTKLFDSPEAADTAIENLELILVDSDQPLATRCGALRTLIEGTGREKRREYLLELDNLLNEDFITLSPDKQIEALSELLAHSEDAGPSERPFFVEKPKLRRMLVEKCASVIAAHYGKDDGSSIYHEEILSPLERIASGVHPALRQELMEEVAKQVVSQRRLSETLERLAFGADSELALEAVFGDIFLNAVRKEPRLGMILFEHLTSRHRDLNTTTDAIIKLRCIHLSNTDGEKITPDMVRKGIVELQDNFDLLAHAQRAVVLHELIRKPDRDPFTVIFPKLLSGNDPLYDDGRRFLSALLIQYHPATQGYVLSALLAGAQENTTPGFPLGKAIGAICSQLDPFSVKFAQALHGAAGVPERLRPPATLKYEVEVLPRWTLWRLVDEALPDAEQAKLIHLGQQIGRGSIWITCAATFSDGASSSEVLQFRAKNAPERAEIGAERLRHTFETLGTPPAVERAIKQALRDTQAECQGLLAEETFAKAHELFSQWQVTILANGARNEVTYDTASLIACGPLYRRVARCEGEPFLERKGDPHLSTYAAAHIALTLTHIVQARGFNTDFTGGNVLHTDDPSRCAAIDYGAIRTAPITPEEKRALAALFVRLATELSSESPDLVSAMDRARSQLAEKLHYSPIVLEVERALLALGDFMKVVPPAALTAALKAASSHIDPELGELILEEVASLSPELQERLQSLLLQPPANGWEITVQPAQAGSNPPALQ